MASFQKQKRRDAKAFHKSSLLDLSLEETRERDAKINALKAKRFLEWFLFPKKWPKPKKAALPQGGQVVFERRTPVARADDFADPRMEAGKLTNLKIAA